MNQTTIPLNEQFEDWFLTLTADQQIFVRKTLVSIYNTEVSRMLSEILFMRDPADLQPEQAGQLMEYIQDFVIQGTDQDVIGGYIGELIAKDTSLKELTDIIVKYAEIIEPTDGSISEYGESVVESEGVDIHDWRKQMFAELGSDIKEVFPEESTNIILEVQQKRAVLRAEDLEANLGQGTRMDFGHQKLH